MLPYMLVQAKAAECKPQQVALNDDVELDYFDRLDLGRLRRSLHKVREVLDCKFSSLTGRAPEPALRARHAGSGTAVQRTGAARGSGHAILARGVLDAGATWGRNLLPCIVLCFLLDLGPSKSHR